MTFESSSTDTERGVASLNRQLVENWQAAETLDHVRGALRGRAYMTLLVVAALAGALTAVALVAPPDRFDVAGQAIVRVLAPSLLAGALLLAVYYLAEMAGRFGAVAEAITVNRRAIEAALAVLATADTEQKS